MQVLYSSPCLGKGASVMWLVQVLGKGASVMWLEIIDPLLRPQKFNSGVAIFLGT